MASFESGDPEEAAQNPYEKQRASAVIRACSFDGEKSYSPNLLEIQPSQIIDDKPFIRTIQACVKSCMNQE